jgi:hypothetical protein
MAHPSANMKARVRRPDRWVGTICTFGQPGSTSERAPIDRELPYARRQPGCLAMMATCGITEQCAVTILAELDDARRVLLAARRALRQVGGGRDVFVREVVRSRRRLRVRCRLRLKSG